MFMTPLRNSQSIKTLHQPIEVTGGYKKGVKCCLHFQVTHNVNSTHFIKVTTVPEFLSFVNCVAGFILPS